MSVFHYYPSPADYVTVLLYSVSVRFYNNDQKQVGCLLNHSGTLNLDCRIIRYPGYCWSLYLDGYWWSLMTFGRPDSPLWFLVGADCFTLAGLNIRFWCCCLFNLWYVSGSWLEYPALGLCFLGVSILWNRLICLHSWYLILCKKYIQSTGALNFKDILYATMLNFLLL